MYTKSLGFCNSIPEVLLHQRFRIQRMSVHVLVLCINNKLTILIKQLMFSLSLLEAWLSLSEFPVTSESSTSPSVMSAAFCGPRTVNSTGPRKRTSAACLCMTSSRRLGWQHPARNHGNDDYVSTGHQNATEQIHSLILVDESSC